MYYHIEKGPRKRSKLRQMGLAGVTLLLALSGHSVYQSLGASTAQLAAPNVSAATPQPVIPQLKINDPMPWPGYGSAAYGVGDKGVLATSNEAPAPVPIASLAKVITAIAILEKKPLQPGEAGPVLTLDAKDADLFREYIHKNGAVVPVEAGENITQHQAMQAMLMSSANNMTDSLVRWAFGSVEAYNEYANKMVREMNMTETTVADASGFSPATKATAPDMAKAAERYMRHPVLREIAMQSEATIPVAGRIQNYNSLVNEKNMYGVKVGDTDEAGRCFILANIRDAGTANEEVSVAVVLGADHLSTAMADARKVLKAGDVSYDHLQATP